MKYLSQEVNLEDFFRLTQGADHRLLLLDYDGTLAPFTVQRDRAFPYPEVEDWLAGMMAVANARTVIISGRAIKDFEGLLSKGALPEIWGSHGWERRTSDGHYSQIPIDEISKNKLRQARAVLDALSYENLVEEKPVSVAAHWRGLEPTQRNSIGQIVMNEWSKIIDNSILEIHQFDGGLELRVKGRNKGAVVSDILSTLSGVVAAAYLGDDITDEDAFKAMEGKGLRVLVRETLRETLADVWLTPPAELMTFLGQWKLSCESSRP